MTFEEFRKYAAPFKATDRSDSEGRWSIFKDVDTARRYLSILGLVCPPINDRGDFDSRLRNAALRYQMRCHPDKGGNTEAFLHARQIVRFFKQEGFF